MKINPAAKLNILTVNLDIIDPRTGAILSRLSKEADSLITQWIQLQYAKMLYLPQTIKDITGINRLFQGSDHWRGDAVYGATTRGITVGAGTTEVTLSDWKLQNQIDHGAGAGQLIYQAQGYSGPFLVGSTYYFDYTRTFNNNSGNNITVNEVGIYVLGFLGVYSYCIERDLTGGLVIPNTKALVATYRFQVSI